MLKFYNLSKLVLIKLILVTGLINALTVSFITDVIASQQLQIVRDAQIESFINNLIDPLVSIHGFNSSDFKVILVYNSNINAFVTSGKQIFINTGLIKSMPDSKALQAVLAHEIAHLHAGHTSRFIDNQSSSLTRLLASAMLAIPLGFITKKPEIAVSVLYAGVESAKLNIYRYSRSLESEADFLALQYLAEIGTNPNAMIRGLKILENEARLAKINNSSYLSHPLLGIRIDSIKTALNNKFDNNTTDVIVCSEKTENNNSTLNECQYDLIKGKIRGFTESPEKTIKLFKVKNIHKTSYIINQVSYSIALMRSYRFKQSINILNSLNNSWQNNPYIAEMKADIYYKSGNHIQALSYYKQAIKLAPNVKLLRLSWLRNINQGNIKMSSTSIFDIITPLFTNRKNVAFWKELANYYNRISNINLRELYLAEVAFQLNRPKEAIARLKPILKHLKSNRNIQKAKDIIYQAEEKLK